MEGKITIYKDGIGIKLPDRKTLIRDTGKGFYFEFIKIDAGRNWKTARCRRLKGKVVTTNINLTYEAALNVAYGLIEYVKSHPELTKKLNEL